MVLVHRFTVAAFWRVILLLSVAFSATLVACGGDDDDPVAATPSAPTSTMSGTAATGAPLRNLTVTLKDSTNRSTTATTNAQGAFTLDTSNMTPPFLLQVTTPGGTRLLSVSTDGNRTGTLNITPISDLVVRSYYQVQGRSADSAFSDPRALPPPSPLQVRSIARMLLDVLHLAIRAANAPITEPEDLISKPFAANGTGIDALLDNTSVTLRPTGADLVLMAGTATQSTALAFVTQTTSITATSSTTDGTVTSTFTSSAVVPVQAAQVTALDQINSSLAALAAVVNSRGTSLTITDLEPFFDASMLDEGLNRSQFLPEVLHEFRQFQSLGLSAEQIRALDTSAGTAEVVVLFTATMDGSTESEREVFFLRRGSDGTWRYFGDGRIASVSVHAEGRRDQGLFSGSNGPSVNVHVSALEGTVSAMSVTSSFGSLTGIMGALEPLEGGGFQRPFFANTGTLSPPLPSAGTPVTVTLQQTAGGSVAYTLPLNAFTTELIQITSPTGTSIPAGPATVTWTLPTTYAVEEIQLSAIGFTSSSPGSSSGFQCINDAPVISPTATSGTVTIPATCSGEPVLFVNINLSTNGVNGERSQVIYGLSRSGP